MYILFRLQLFYLYNFEIHVEYFSYLSRFQLHVEVISCPHLVTNVLEFLLLDEVVAFVISWKPYLIYVTTYSHIPRETVLLHSNMFLCS